MVKRIISQICLNWFFLIFSLWADVVFLTDGTLLRGKITSETEKEITVDIFELRTSAKAFSQNNFPFRNQKNSWKAEVIKQDLLYFSGNPLLEGAVINKKLVKQILNLPPAEIYLADGKFMEKDFYRKTTTAIYYYDLREAPSSDFVEERKEKKESNLYTKEDLTGKDDYIPSDIQNGLQKKSLSDVKEIYIKELDQKKKIFPEKKKWLSDGLVGLSYSLLIPTGEISALPISPLGFLASFSYELSLGNLFPFFYRYNLRSRVGLLGGWQRFFYETSYSYSEIHLFPFVGYLSILYDLPLPWGTFQFSPFFRLSQGVIVSNIKKNLRSEFIELLSEESPQKKESYIGSATFFHLGTEFFFRKHPRFIYSVGLGYWLHAEKIAGTFLSLEISFGYLF